MDAEVEILNFLYFDFIFEIILFKGGPCGVLAAVQATLLKHLLFERGSERRIKRYLLSKNQ